jgi:hypothetical protein
MTNSYNDAKYVCRNRKVCQETAGFPTEANCSFFKGEGSECTAHIFLWDICSNGLLCDEVRNVFEPPQIWDSALDQLLHTLRNTDRHRFDGIMPEVNQLGTDIVVEEYTAPDFAQLHL